MSLISQKLPPIPSKLARRGHTAVIWKYFLILFGGACRSDSSFVGIYFFNFKTNMWYKVKTHGDVKQSREAHIAVVFQDEMYIAFGDHFTHYCTNNVYKLNLNNYMWRLVPTSGVKPSQRRQASGVLYKNGIYIFGGHFFERYFNDMYRLDLIESKWEVVEQIGDLPLERRGHVCVTHQDDMYIIGGVINDSCHFANDLYKFNFSSKMWTFISKKSIFRRIGSAGVFYDSKIFLFGGFGRPNDKQSEEEELNDCIAVDIVTGSTQQVQIDGPIPPKRSWHSITFDKNKMYIFGGEYDDSETSSYKADFYEIHFYIKSGFPKMLMDKVLQLANVTIKYSSE